MKLGKERRDFNVEIRAKTDADTGKRSLRGHAAVFEELSEDLGGFREKIRAGAFAEAIKTDDVRALFNHDPNHVLGRSTSGTLRMKEDKDGLLVDIDLPDTQVARDLHTSVERGDISQMSFGFSVREGGQEWFEDDDGQAIRTLTNLRLFDVSPVTYPAYPQTDVAARSLQEFRSAHDTSGAEEEERKRTYEYMSKQLDLL